MKNILIFANESQSVKEIVQYFISKYFNITIFTFKPIYDKSIFVGASPFQVNFLITNIANYYNWKHEIHKHDIIINALTIDDFPRQNRKTVFANFTTFFAESTAGIGKTVIYISNLHNDPNNEKVIQEAENSMLNINKEIFYLKCGFLINSDSKFLTDLINAKFVFSSSKILQSEIQITNVADLSCIIFKIISGEECHKNIALSNETFTFKDMIILIKNCTKSEKHIIRLPHFALMLFSKCMMLLPGRLYPRFYNYGVISNILHIGKNHFRPSTAKSYTLFVSIADKHSTHLFTPNIE